jgi:hypothetical protein
MEEKVHIMREVVLSHQELLVDVLNASRIPGCGGDLHLQI